MWYLKDDRGGTKGMRWIKHFLEGRAWERKYQSLLKMWWAGVFRTLMYGELGRGVGQNYYSSLISTEFLPRHPQVYLPHGYRW